jgi:predicted RNase H-like HicB family nuclease
MATHADSPARVDNRQHSAQNRERQRPLSRAEEQGQAMDHLTAVFEHTDDWWIASIEELPGVNTQGATLDEARENLHEALRLVLETNREIAREASAGKEVIREPFTPTT